MRRFLLAFVLPAALVACDPKKPPPPPKPPATTTPDAPEAPAADAKPYASRDKAQDGAIAGRVVFKGEITLPPPPPPTTECHELENELIVRDADSGLQNVFVYIRKGDTKNWTFDAPPEPITLDQRGCRYYPHVQGMVAGQSMTIKSSDDFMHNVHSLAKENPAWSIACMGRGEQTLTTTTTHKTFTKREVMVPIKCDVHAWMGTWIGVLPHTLFAVTGPDGAFRIDGVPPGEYTVEAWHEFLGNKAALPKATSPIQRTVNVEAGKTVELDLEFKM